MMEEKTGISAEAESDRKVGEFEREQPVDKYQRSGEPGKKENRALDEC